MSRNTHRPEMHRNAPVKEPCRAATTAAGTLASDFENGDTVDGVTLATGDRILIKNQAAGAENGIYIVDASGAPARAYDMDASAEVKGVLVHVKEGTANGGKIFRNTNTGAFTLGSTAMTWAEISVSPGTISTTGALEVVIDGGGSAITTGIKGDVEMPFAGTFMAWRIFADASGDIQIDVWKDVYSAFPPTDADAMPGAGKEPKIPASGAKAEDTSITDWTTDDFAAGDVLRFNVDSATTITRATLVLYYTRTL